MIFSRLVKQFILPGFLLYGMGWACFIFAASKQTKHGIESLAQQNEILVPQNIVTSLLQAYSEKEKSLIQDDLINITQMSLRDKTPSSQTERVYVATAGGPGACKSTILETYIHDKPNFVYADPDARALKLMTNTYHQSLTYYQISKNASYQELLKDAYSKWRDASNYIANSILNDAYAKGYNIAHGTTLTGPVISQLFSKLQQKNYKIVLLLCYGPDDTRVKIIEHRAKTHAVVQSAAEDVINKGKIFPERFPIYFEYADEIHLYWTQDLEQWSVHAATYTKDAGLMIHNTDAWASFIQKYDTDRNGFQLPSLDELTKQKCSVDLANA